LSSKSNHRKALEFEKKFHKLVKKGNFDVTVAMNRIRNCNFYFAADDCIKDEFLRKHSSFIVNLLPRYRIFSQIENDIFIPESKTKVFYIAKRQKIAFQNRYQTPEEHLIYLPPGIPDKYKSIPSLNEFEAIRSEFNIILSDTMLVFVGANFKLKGLDRIIEQFSLLPKKILNNLKLLVVGPGDKDSFLPIIKSKNLEKNIIFAGGRTDTERLITAADMMFHLPYSEATGTVIVEALACNTPVLCTENCGFAEFANSAGCPVVKSPFNKEDANKQLLYMLNNLTSIKNNVTKYAKENNFFLRAKLFVDFIEQYKK
jgi:UDP-glucose:(heptosyl)LPS alpha-1,3-glucosyltransferase